MNIPNSENIENCYIYQTTNNKLCKCKYECDPKKSLLSLKADINTECVLPQDIIDYHKYASNFHEYYFKNFYNLDKGISIIEDILSKKCKRVTKCNINLPVEQYKRQVKNRNHRDNKFKTNSFGNICEIDKFSADGGRGYTDIISFQNEIGNKENSIVSVKYENDNKKMFNIVYVNSNMFKSLKENVDRFDIDICKQIFNGNKFHLRSISGLINKKFTCSPTNIQNIKGYVTSMKRINKYIARGFGLIDFDKTIEHFKEYYNIPKNLSEIQINVCKEHYEKTFSERSIRGKDPLGWSSYWKN